MPRNLAVDNEILVPVNKVVHVLVTSSDVIHDWTIPSFGSKVDAVPGRITATWFKATKEGLYFGQCSELCGKDHAFMPIAVRVVKEKVFDDWAAALKAQRQAKAKEIIRNAALNFAGRDRLPGSSVGRNSSDASVRGIAGGSNARGASSDAKVERHGNRES